MFKNLMMEASGIKKYILRDDNTTYTTPAFYILIRTLSPDMGFNQIAVIEKHVIYHGRPVKDSAYPRMRLELKALGIVLAIEHYCGGQLTTAELYNSDSKPIGKEVTDKELRTLLFETTRS
jgi:hypothetical protein